MAMERKVLEREKVVRRLKIFVAFSISHQVCEKFRNSATCPASGFRQSLQCSRKFSTLLKFGPLEDGSTAV